jgi:hypothetical protein
MKWYLQRCTAHWRKGIGGKPFFRQIPDPELKYAQIVKERENGK